MHDMKDAEGKKIRGHPDNQPAEELPASPAAEQRASPKPVSNYIHAKLPAIATGTTSATSRNQLDVLPHDCSGTQSQKKIETKKNDQQIIHLSESQKKIRHQVNRQNHIGQDCQQYQLRTQRHSWIFHQARKQFHEAR